jgi:ribonuclease HII
MSRLITPTFDEEKTLNEAGFSFIAGVDEAGCGCWAGPVFAAAVILPLGWEGALLRDSKMMSARQREKSAESIRVGAVAWSVASASVEEIDALNIRRAAGLAQRRALESLSVPADFVLVDAFKIPEATVPQKNIIRGDALVASIAAASILAKTERDRVICGLAREYPGYGFENHKGYGTKEHQSAIKKLGPCPIHRKSYAPVKACSVGC